MGEWKEVILRDVVTILGDGLHGTPQYDDNGEYYFINGNNLSNGKIIIKQGTKKANKEEYEKYKKELNDRTIFVSINGTLGNVALYNNEKCILGKSACYFNVLKEIDKHFIKYVITDKNFQEYIQNFANGTTIKNVSLNIMRDYPFLLPPINEQRAIASILSSLDDKIDLLHRQNKTLEQLAETLFRQWFVEEADESWEEFRVGDMQIVINDFVANGSFASLKENVTLIPDVEDYALLYATQI
ncbi:MAG: restriction endonuclease subunit S [Ignavibacterium sp.]|nr:restriction endonuclease subunit S [Ignavibacterium sp.]